MFPPPHLYVLNGVVERLSLHWNGVFQLHHSSPHMDHNGLPRARLNYYNLQQQIEYLADYIVEMLS